MAQLRCPWCHRLGPYVSERELKEEYADPHADGSECVCRHVRADNRLQAIADGGRYWNGTKWICPSCGTAPAPTEEEWCVIDLSRTLNVPYNEAIQRLSTTLRRLKRGRNQC